MFGKSSDGLGDALARFNSSSPGSDVNDPTLGNDTGKGSKSTTGKGADHFQVHVHKDGTHHLMAHKCGQLVHHSEHASMEEAAEQMKALAGPGKHDRNKPTPEAGNEGGGDKETVED